MKLKIVGPIFLTIAAFVLFTSPTPARANCDIQANLNVDPVIQRVPRSKDTVVQRTGTLSWTASGVCQEGIAINVSLRDFIDTPSSLGKEIFSKKITNLPLSGSVNIEFPQQTFAKQAKLECWVDEDPDTFPQIVALNFSTTPLPTIEEVKSYYENKTCYEGPNLIRKTAEGYDTTLPGARDHGFNSWWGDIFTSMTEGTAYPDGKITSMSTGADPRKLIPFCDSKITYAEYLVTGPHNQGLLHPFTADKVPTSIPIAWQKGRGGIRVLSVPIGAFPPLCGAPDGSDPKEVESYMKSIAAPGATISYTFNGIKIFPNIVGFHRLDHDMRVRSFISYEVIEGGGTHLLGRVNTCSLFEDVDSSICTQESGPPGPVLPNVVLRPFGPAGNFGWGTNADFPSLSKYPVPPDFDGKNGTIKNIEIKIDPEYAKEKEVSAKYTPVYSGNNRIGNASPLDKFRVKVKAPSFRTHEMYNSRLKLVTKGRDGQEIALVEPEGWPLELVLKDGVHITPPDLNTIPPAMEAWYQFKNKIISDYETTGNAYIYLEGMKDKLSQPTSMRILDPKSMGFTRPYDLGTDYKYVADREYILKPYEVISIRKPRDDDPNAAKLNVYSSIPEWLTSDKYAGEFMRQFYASGGDFSRMLGRPFAKEEAIMSPEIDTFFKTEGPVLTFETPVIDLKGDKQIIDAIAEKRPLEFKVVRGSYDPASQKTNYPLANLVEKKDVELTNCARLVGDGKLSIVIMKGKKTGAGITNDSYLDQSKDGLAYLFRHEPFKNYASHFSASIDLADINDSVIDTKTNLEALQKLKNINTSCPSNALVKAMMMDVNTMGSYDGLAGEGTLFFRNQPISEQFPKNSHVSALTHEIGHAIGRLGDESPMGNMYINVRRRPSYGEYHRNCSIDPVNDFSDGRNRYGDTNTQGCVELVEHPVTHKDTPMYIPGYPGILSIMQYQRPSGGWVKDGKKPNGLNNYRAWDSSDEEKLNFTPVACGWVMTAIKGGSAKSHFAECAQLLGVTPL